MAGSLYAKLGLRIVPILFFGYLVNYLDRVNISFARLTMSASLGLGDAAYGLGAGLFFIGYFTCQVPANLLLRRYGARRWLALIILVWGAISASTALVSHAWQFHAVRFFLGAAEAGFFPGVILYLTEWFPARVRARILASFLTAIPVSGLVGGPLSGWIMGAFHGGGLESWQWLFLIEGIPCLLAALWIFAALPDRPAELKSLTQEERGELEAALRAEAEERALHGAPSQAAATFRLPVVWKLCSVYFCAMMGLYGFSFWLPELLKNLGWETPLQIGLASAVPWSAAAAFMVWLGARADRRRSWRRCAAFAALVGGVGFALCGYGSGGRGWEGLLFLCLAAAGVMGMMATQWALPGSLLSGAAAAAAIALVNSCGNLGGFLSPTLVGLLVEKTGRLAAGPWLTSAFMFLAAVLLSCFRSLDPSAHGSAPADRSR
ncbi:MAG: MFS transporter [Verrucomicrobium sp.]|nr:MFS transporter [Verrucomicrobium sp.]